MDTDVHVSFPCKDRIIIAQSIIKQHKTVVIAAQLNAYIMARFDIAFKSAAWFLTKLRHWEKENSRFTWRYACTYKIYIL